MKKIIILTTLFFSSSLYANNTYTNLFDFFDAYSVKTQNKAIPSTKFKIDDSIINVKFKKITTQEAYEDKNGRTIFALQDIFAAAIFDKGDSINFYKEESIVYGQSVNSLYCKNKQGEILLTLLLSYADVNYIYGGYVQFKPSVYIVDIENKTLLENETIEKELYFGNVIINKIIDDSDIKKPELYPYYNEEKILTRLYETGSCDKEATKNANIQALLGDKWVPQEKSWNMQKSRKQNTLDEIETLSYIENKVKVKDEMFLNAVNNSYLNLYLNKYALSENLVRYNNIAFYLEQAGYYEESIYLLEKITEKYPNRTVAYINLGDAYWGVKDIDKAKQAYEKYIELMKADNKEQRIPKRIYERVAQEDE